jgi:hypothetical protein
MPDWAIAEADLEPAQPGDAYRDYCLWTYAPVASPTGKLRSAALLWQSFAVAGADPRLAALSRDLRAGLGPFRTVWGVKRAGGVTSWEYYFYDYARVKRAVSLGRVLDILRPYAPSRLVDPRLRPYFMVSLDLDDALVQGRRSIEQANIYVGNPGSSVSSGLCYAMTDQGFRLDNLYNFFDAARERQMIRDKVAASVHLDEPGLDVDAILWPALTRCGVIVVANKRLNDGVYFSRVRVDGLIHFLERTDWPEETRRFVRDNRGRLDHMLYDVGIDYRAVDGKLTVVKSAYYGVL